MTWVQTSSPNEEIMDTAQLTAFYSTCQEHSAFTKRLHDVTYILKTVWKNKL